MCYHALAPLQAKSGRCQFESTVTTNPTVQAPHHHDHQLHHHKQIALLCFLDLYIYTQIDISKCKTVELGDQLHTQYSAYLK